MFNLSPEVLDLLDQVRDIALGYPETEEYSPWGNRAFFREMKGRNFLFANEKEGFLEIMFRFPPGAREIILRQPFVEISPSMGYKDWATARITSLAELENIKSWIDVSYKLNKPVRTTEDYIEGEAREILEFLTQVREAALNYGNVEEFFPYGDRAFRSKKGKIFLYASEQGEYLNVQVRLPLGEREDALSLPFVEVPKYIGHKGWVGAKVSKAEQLEIVIPWIEVSYYLNNPARKTRVKKKGAM